MLPPLGCLFLQLQWLGTTSLWETCWPHLPAALVDRSGFLPHHFSEISFSVGGQPGSSHTHSPLEVAVNLASEVTTASVVFLPACDRLPSKDHLYATTPSVIHGLAILIHLCSLLLPDLSLSRIRQRQDLISLSLGS